MSFWGKQRYAAQLNDARWKKLRRQVLKRDGNSCQDCGTVVGSMHVHHLYYTPEAAAWEYPLDALLTLCEECHRVASGLPATPKVVFRCLQCWRPVDTLSYSEANRAFCRDCLPDDCGKRFPDGWPKGVVR